MQRLMFLFCCGLLASCWFPKEKQQASDWEHLLKKKNIMSVRKLSLDSLTRDSLWGNWNIGAFQPVGAMEYICENNAGDTLSVVQISFSRDYQAFGVYKKIAGESFRGLQEVLRAQRIFLQHNETISALKILNGSRWNFSKINEFSFLSDSGHALPSIFNSFPQRGRLERSEMIIAEDFLGLKSIGEVAQVSYPCYFDTLTAFRTFFNPWQRNFSEASTNFLGRVDTLSSDLIQFSGETEFGTPLLLFGHETGLLGLLGCPDLDLAQKIAQKTLKLNSLIEIIP